MSPPGKARGFTLCFQETPADEKWISALGDILVFAGRFRKAAWRRKHLRSVNKVFFGIHKSGISIDTIEKPRVAVVLGDEVEIETKGRNGNPGMRRVESWGRGGKTPAQLKRKLVALLTQVLEVWEWVYVPDPEYEIDRADVMGLLGFIASQDPKGIETFS